MTNFWIFLSHSKYWLIASLWKALALHLLLLLNLVKWLLSMPPPFREGSWATLCKTSYSHLFHGPHPLIALWSPLNCGGVLTSLTLQFQLIRVDGMHQCRIQHNHYLLSTSYVPGMVGARRMCAQEWTAYFQHLPPKNQKLTLSIIPPPTGLPQ